MKILILANSIESVGGGGPGGPVCNPEPPNKQSDGGSSQLVSSKEKHKGMTEIMATLILQLFFLRQAHGSPHMLIAQPGCLPLSGALYAIYVLLYHHQKSICSLGCELFT